MREDGQAEVEANRTAHAPALPLGRVVSSPPAGHVAGGAGSVGRTPPAAAFPSPTPAAAPTLPAAASGSAFAAAAAPTTATTFAAATTFAHGVCSFRVRNAGRQPTSR